MRWRVRLFCALFGISVISLLLATILNYWFLRTVVDDRIALIQRGTAVGLFLAFSGAFVLAWLASAVMSRKLTEITSVAHLDTDRDLKRSDYQSNEISTADNVFDETIQESGSRVSEHSRNQQLTDIVFSSVSEGILVVDAKGNIRMANDAVRGIFQIKKLVLDCHHVELIRQPDLTKQITTVLAGGGLSRIEIMLNTDPPKTCLSIATPFMAWDEPGVVVVLHDVTSYRWADQIRQDFVANVSHELRTPLTAIRGSTDALLDQNNIEADRRFLEIISRHTIRMERLVSDLLRLTKLDAGQEALNLVPCSIESLFASVQTELALLLEKKKQNILINTKHSSKTFIVDSIKLHDVLKNLVENSAHYSPEETVIELDSFMQDGSLFITVKDRGPGIPDVDLERVFERFYRVEQSRVREPGGTGLGLSIVKHLIGLHRGTVLAENRPGGGSVFTIKLPQEGFKNNEASNQPNV